MKVNPPSKHKERDTYEIPGGRREEGETILGTAERELYEETGALKYDKEPICVYSVIGKTRVNESGDESFGMLYFATIEIFENVLHSEMEKIELFDELLMDWTYPLIQPKLIEEAKERGMKKNVENDKSTFERIYDVVKQIPYGKVATYGQVAALAGNKRWSRVVGYALHVNPDPENIPCYRVVNRLGEVSKAFAFGGENRQIELLEAEGIEFVDGRVNMDKYQWNQVTIDMMK